MSMDFSTTVKWTPDIVSLPTGFDEFNVLKDITDDIYKTTENPEWLDNGLSDHIVDVGETLISRDVAAVVATKGADGAARTDRLNEEVNEVIDAACDEVNIRQEDYRDKIRNLEEHIWEEEVAARNLLLNEYKVKEANLFHSLRKKGGILHTVPADKFSWTVEWMNAPQQFKLNITSLRGARGKMRDGYYTIMASVLDRVGGRVFRFTTGKEYIDCSATLPPMRFLNNSSSMDRYINKSVAMKCPAPKAIGSYACLMFEIWQLRAGNHDITDKVIAWGVFPLVDRNFRILEGKFKISLIKGEADSVFDTYRQVTNSIQDDLKYWFGNLYVEILASPGHRMLKKSYNIERDTTNRINSVLYSFHEQQRQDDLRLARTACDHRQMIVPKLPESLFFDDVGLNNQQSHSLKQHCLGSDCDMRPLNTALWDKRMMLEDERAAMENDLYRTNLYTYIWNDERNDTAVRNALSRSKNHVVGNLHTDYPEIPFSKEKDTTGHVKYKYADSHILLNDHHISVASQREIYFLGRRYMDKFNIWKTVLLDDIGLNVSGSCDKLSFFITVLFLILGLIGRNITHAAGLWLYFKITNVPATLYWSVFYTDVQFVFPSRFHLAPMIITMFVGVLTGIIFFIIFSLCLFKFMHVFDWVPYFMTRFNLWFGIGVFLDPIISITYQYILEYTETGDSFILINLLHRGRKGTDWAVTFSAYGILMMLQAGAVYWFSCVVHLNGRVNDIYSRLVYPESSFFSPHDLEVSIHDVRSAIINASKYYDEHNGITKTVNASEFSHKNTCYFRARLFKLLSIRSDDPNEWISEYFDTVLLRSSRYSKENIVQRLGAFKLGNDIKEFMKRRFPYLTDKSYYRYGETDEDSYYEAELLRGMKYYATKSEDELEMRNMLRVYFKAQLDCAKPVKWIQKEGNEDLTLSTPFVVTDFQLLADLIFFETSDSIIWPSRRKISLFTNLGFKQRGGQYILPNFTRGNAARSIGEGKECHGRIVTIFKENVSKGTKELSRIFVMTPFGTIIDPNCTNFSFMEYHTADDAEFWAKKAIDSLSEGDLLLVDKYK